MILCLCQGVTEREVTELIGHGAASVSEVTRLCGAGGDCGSCRPDIESCLRAERTRPAPSRAA